MSDDTEARDMALIGRALKSLRDESGDVPGSHGQCSLLWEDEGVFLIQEEGIGVTIACARPGAKPRAMWIPTPILPALIDAAKRVVERERAP